MNEMTYLASSFTHKMNADEIFLEVCKVIDFVTDIVLIRSSLLCHVRKRRYGALVSVRITNKQNKRVLSRMVYKIRNQSDLVLFKNVITGLKSGLDILF